MPNSSEKNKISLIFLYLAIKENPEPRREV
jgi:hypothetical protein